MKNSPPSHLSLVPSHQENLNLKALEGLKTGDIIHLATENSTYRIEVVCDLSPYLVGQVVGGNNKHLNLSGILMMLELKDGYRLALESTAKPTTFLKTSRISGMTVEKAVGEKIGRQATVARVALVRLFQKTAQ